MSALTCSTPMLFAEDTLRCLDVRRRFVTYTELEHALPCLPRTTQWWQELAPGTPNPAHPLIWPNWQRIRAAPPADRDKELARCLDLAPGLCQTRADAILAELVEEHGTLATRRLIHAPVAYLRNRVTRHRLRDAEGTVS